MPLIWNDSLATGLRQIDLQHQELIELVNALEKLEESGLRQELLEEVLPKLNAYVLFHFGTEEALLPGVSDEHAKQHREQHRGFTDKVAALRREAPEKIDLTALVAYLKRWLIEHIMKTDQELARQILAKQATR